MAYRLTCPCGTHITSYDDDFIADVQAHLTAEHPGRTYTEDEIMWMALPVSDKLVTPKT